MDLKQSLEIFHGINKVPQTLGSFKLDDHNVDEWSDFSVTGVKHKGRTEVGKWVNPDTNADIHYQKVSHNTIFR